MFLCVVTGTLAFSIASGQSHWAVPQLQVLGWKADRIGSGKTLLSPPERMAVARITGRDIGKCVSDSGPGGSKTFSGNFDNLRVERVLLSATALRGLIVQGSGDCMCGATGNCNFWLVAERPSGFDVVLQTIGIQSFEIRKTMSNGFFDVVLGAHDSATEADLSLYHYTGSYYRRAACALMSYEGPNWTVLKTPHVTPQKCD
jgi:hypothetical protein